MTDRSTNSSGSATNSLAELFRLAAYSFVAFACLWLLFTFLFHRFPYISTGADVVFRSKIVKEQEGGTFSSDAKHQRVAIFGTSRVLAGFVPAYFDRLAANDGVAVESFNSGFPARTTFVPELASMADHGLGPDIVLLTQPWRERTTIFHPIRSDYDVAESLFPFRHLLRDFVSFVFTSRQHGGMRKFYNLSRQRAVTMLRDRGYYFIEEQSHYPSERLPDDFQMPTDTPTAAHLRIADATSQDLAHLNQVLREHHIRCYYVPDYLRSSAAAPAPPRDQSFADLLQKHSTCILLGPDYFSYPNSFFSDEAHLNHKGAMVYTADIYRLLSEAGRK